MTLILPAAMLAVAVLAYSQRAKQPSYQVIPTAPGGFKILINGREFRPPSTATGQRVTTPDGRVFVWNGMTWDFPR